MKTGGGVGQKLLVERLGGVVVVAGLDSRRFVQRLARHRHRQRRGVTFEVAVVVGRPAVDARTAVNSLQVHVGEDADDDEADAGGADDRHDDGDVAADLTLLHLGDTALHYWRDRACEREWNDIRIGVWRATLFLKL